MLARSALTIHPTTRCLSSVAPSDSDLFRYGVPLLARAAEHAHAGRTLTYDMYDAPRNDTDKKMVHSYHDVLSMSSHLHKFIKQQKKEQIGAHDPPKRVAFLCPPCHRYIYTKFACWSSGFVAVPMCISYPSNQLAYLLEDCDPSLVIDGTSNGAASELHIAAKEVGILDRYHRLDDLMHDFDPSQIDEYALGSDGDVYSIDAPALVIYTSGTTGKPKGVVHTHRSITHQVTDLVSAWKWSEDDSILHFLPLHHVHGIVNKLLCAIWAGGSVEFMKFNPIKLWERLAEASMMHKLKLTGNFKDKNVEYEKREPTIFMGVPTIYSKMLEVAQSGFPEHIDAKGSCSHLRLMVSGSAALPSGIHQRWKELTGHTILERYGMTEFAMALSNPLVPVEKRLAGYVGLPLPSVEVKIVSEQTGETIPKHIAQSGELCVRGPTVFREYWRKQKATEESFDAEGFFKTGDVAEYNPDLDSYRILGRISADIIKSSGYKLSALEIEREILEHPDLIEVVVLGVPDEVKGESVALICRMSSCSTRDIGLKELQDWCRERLANYQIPSVMIVLDSIPKNAMGKVNKKELVRLFQ